MTFDQLNDTSVVSEKQPQELEKSFEIKKLDDMIANYLRRVLIQTDGQIHGKNGAAMLLGINPRTLRSRMKKLGVEYGKNK